MYNKTLQQRQYETKLRVTKLRALRLSLDATEDELARMEEYVRTASGHKAARWKARLEKALAKVGGPVVD